MTSPDSPQAANAPEHDLRPSPDLSHLPPQRAERAALCQLLRRLGPDAPTLCEGWATREMAAHLVAREHNPLAALGIMVPFLSRLHDDALARAERRRTYEQLVAAVEAGPPLQWKLIDPVANLVEFVVHHEDVRRGGGDHTPRPEGATMAVDRAVWKTLGRSSWLLARKVHGLRLTLESGGRTSHQVGRTGEAVTLKGRPIEVLLYLMGRKTAAQVELVGSEAAVARLAATDLSL